MSATAPTRQRLVDAGTRLFAERGFGNTAVGEIEAAAGLQPRRGALYKHFPSKQALLEATVQAHLDRAATAAAQIDEVDLSGALGADPALLRGVIRSLGRWLLEGMDSVKDLTRLFEHDGQRAAELTAAVKANVVDLSYRSAATLIRAVAPNGADPEATAVLLLGALVALRRTEWTFGSPPLDLDDQRALTAWVDLTLAMLSREVSA